MKTMLRECPTRKYYEKMRRIKQYDQRKKMLAAQEQVKKILKDDITKVPREQSQKLMTKDQVR